MRLRYVKNARELIEKHQEYIIDDVEHHQLNLEKMFKNKNPLHIEIGMGKGQFIYELAKQNKEINYIGIEKFDSAIVKGLEKLIEEPLENLYLLRADAIDLMKLFIPKSISRIYLNFSDPWPKERHVKRRLTSKRFLDMYKVLLLKGAEVHFKTDNRDLFDYSVESINDYPMDTKYLTYNLHSEDVENIMTEFEEKFSNKGFSINKLIAKFQEDCNE
jgi:tRNA (guanine-N7-)-methyltransferase